MYPIEKYKFYTDGKTKVIAVSTYGGRTVRGVAKCSPQDTFDLEKGKELAALRCNLRVAEKRSKRAYEKCVESLREYNRMNVKFDKMEQYLMDAEAEEENAMRLLRDFEAKI